MIKAQVERLVFYDLIWLERILQVFFKAAIVLALTSKTKTKPHTVFNSDGTMAGSLKAQILFLFSDLIW